jgi:DNA-binding XRE family transcriptional regulator
LEPHRHRHAPGGQRVDQAGEAFGEGAALILLVPDEVSDAERGEVFARVPVRQSIDGLPGLVLPDLHADLESLVVAEADAGVGARRRGEQGGAEEGSVHEPILARRARCHETFSGSRSYDVMGTTEGGPEENITDAFAGVPGRPRKHGCVPGYPGVGEDGAYASDHQKGLDMVARVRAQMGPEPFEVMLQVQAALPVMCRVWPPERLFQFLRCRLGLTQHELAHKAGLAPSQITRLEGGRDCLLSTWRRAYAALGLELSLLPLSGLSIVELEERAAGGRPSVARPPSLRPHGPWFKRPGGG